MADEQRVFMKLDGIGGDVADDQPHQGWFEVVYASDGQNLGGGFDTGGRKYAPTHLWVRLHPPRNVALLMQAARDGRTFSYVVVERVEGKYVFRREYRNLVAVSYHTGGETDEMEFGIAGDE